MRVLGPTDAAFGVVIPASSEHLHWVRGACASIRRFMGDTPICLLLEGRGSADDLRATYGVRVEHQSTVEHPGLRALRGSTKAKLLPLWVAPYETFLLLDADMVVWGDVREIADLERFDFVVDSPIGPVRARRSVMDAEAVGALYPSFDALRYVDRYFNCGAYFARRGALELERFLELLRDSAERLGVFLNDQGFLNFMVFAGLEDGTLRVDQREVQAMIGDLSDDELRRRFSFVGGQPRVDGPPVVLHWVGAGTVKPTMRARGQFVEPMAYFRREYRIARRGATSPSARDELRLRLEDALCSDFRGSNLRGRLARGRRRAVRRARSLAARINSLRAAASRTSGARTARR
jgi:hypothetical protein